MTHSTDDSIADVLDLVRVCRHFAIHQILLPNALPSYRQSKSHALDRAYTNGHNHRGSPDDLHGHGHVVYFPLAVDRPFTGGYREDEDEASHRTSILERSRRNIRGNLDDCVCDAVLHPAWT